MKVAATIAPITLIFHKGLQPFGRVAKKSQIEVRLTCARHCSNLPAAATALGFVLFYGNEGYP